MIEEKRIYAVVAGTIQVPVAAGTHKPPLRSVMQPAGRQVAQACHAVSKLRHILVGLGTSYEPFEPMTTIVLQARDSAELGHVYILLSKKKLNPVMFSDTNPQYGPGEWPTAFAVLATKKQIENILDYLPLWGN